MNCKQGDLAIVVKSLAGHEGKVVRVLKFVGVDRHMVGDDRWLIDRVLHGCYGTPSKTFKDAWLRPIRDQDGADETLTWKAVPKQPETV